MSSNSSTKFQTSFIHNKVDHFNKIFKKARRRLNFSLKWRAVIIIRRFNSFDSFIASFCRNWTICTSAWWLVNSVYSYVELSTMEYGSTEGISCRKHWSFYEWSLCLGGGCSSAWSIVFASLTALHVKGFELSIDDIFFCCS